MLARLNIISTAIFLAALFGIHAASHAHDSHPQEVLDLISAYEELAMKVRPLQDRVVVRHVEEDKAGFKPEGAPIRAKVSTADADEHGRIKVRFATLKKQVETELERIHKPGFAERTDESTTVVFGDGRHGSRLPAGKTQQGGLRHGSGADPKVIAEARRKLAALQREYSVLQRQVKAPERH